jgi:hypothetical protein
MMSIGFFGDSYCSVCDHTGYETYIHKLKTHYNANITNLGISGSSIYDSMLIQFDNHVKNNTVPDVCVFTWTSMDRLFNREKRNINVNTKEKIFEDYFKYLYDEEQANLQAYGSLMYFDNEVLSKYKDKKIIHLFCFTNEFNIFNKTKKFVFNNGVIILPFLYNIAKIPPNEYISSTKNITEPNHIIGEGKNNYLFTTIKNAIDNYK